MHVTCTVYNIQGRGLVWSPEVKYVRRPLKSMTFILVIPIYYVKICRHLHDIYTWLVVLIETLGKSLESGILDLVYRQIID